MASGSGRYLVDKRYAVDKSAFTAEQIDEAWSRFIDPDSKEYYYYNWRTQESSWVEPDGFVYMEPPVELTRVVLLQCVFRKYRAARRVREKRAAAKQWMRVWDGRSKAFYYLNTVTHETSYDPPPGWDPSFAADVEVPKEIAAARKLQAVGRGFLAKRRVQEIRLPSAPIREAQWLQLFSKEHGAFYYYNCDTEETTWEKPARFRARLEAPRTILARMKLQKWIRGTLARLNLRPSWWRCFDPTSGAYYYTHHTTYESVWELPRGAKLLPEPPADLRAIELIQRLARRKLAKRRALHLKLAKEAAAAEALARAEEELLMKESWDRSTGHPAIPEELSLIEMALGREDAEYARGFLMLKKRKVYEKRKEETSRIARELAVRGKKFEEELFAAAEEGSVEKVEAVGRVIDVNSKKKYTGSSCMHIAAAHGHTEVILALVRLGATTINDVDKRGYTPLHLAVVNNGLSAVKALLAHGADRSLPASNGKRALDFAKEIGALSIQAVLEAPDELSSKEFVPPPTADPPTDTTHNYPLWVKFNTVVKGGTIYISTDPYGFLEDVDPIDHYEAQELTADSNAIRKTGRQIGEVKADGPDTGCGGVVWVKAMVVAPSGAKSDHAEFQYYVRSQVEQYWLRLPKRLHRYVRVFKENGYHTLESLGEITHELLSARGPMRIIDPVARREIVNACKAAVVGGASKALLESSEEINPHRPPPPAPPQREFMSMKEIMAEREAGVKRGLFRKEEPKPLTAAEKLVMDDPPPS